MWIWDGQIRPEPGESIHDAIRIALHLARRYGAGSKYDETAQKYDICFTFIFNDTPVRVFADSTVKELVQRFLEMRTVPA
jgi:hypothetical protein